MQWNVRRAREDGGPHTAGAAGDALQIGLEEFMTWINGSREADQQVIDRMIDRLQNQRLSSWDELSRYTSRRWRYGNKGRLAAGQKPYPTV